jgi:hypothetical protein
VMLLAGWLDDGRKLELRGGDRCRDRDSERCGKQPPPKKIASSIGWIHPYLRVIFLGTGQSGKHELLDMTDSLSVLRDPLTHPLDQLMDIVLVAREVRGESAL